MVGFCTLIVLLIQNCTIFVVIKSKKYGFILEFMP